MSGRWGVEILIPGFGFRVSGFGFLSDQSVRGGCSATRIGSLIWVFGGVDGKRKLLNDVYTLDLHSLVWEEVSTRYPSTTTDNRQGGSASGLMLYFLSQSEVFAFSYAIRTLKTPKP